MILEWSVQKIKRNTKFRIEEVIKAWKIADDGMLCCHVGYVAVSMLSNYNPTNFDGIFLRVKRDLRKKAITLMNASVCVSIMVL